MAPDLLRQLAKSFPDESNEVKLQTLNLAVRLWSTDRERCELLVKYVMQLARYDKSYDIRDRCRILRNCLFKDSPFPIDCFKTEKPSPTFHSQFSDREHYQLGTLSHLLNQKCIEYTPLPDFPEVAPDPTIRRSAMPLASDEIKNNTEKQKKSYSDTDESFSGEELSNEKSGESEEESGSELEEESEVSFKLLNVFKIGALYFNPLNLERKRIFKRGRRVNQARIK